jgi:hypothetical protein
VADAELVDHTRSCPDCRCGSICGAGDDAAETEYRAWADYRDAHPGDARAYRADQIERWSP